MGKGRFVWKYFFIVNAGFSSGGKRSIGSNLNLLRLNLSEIVTILPTTVFVHNI